MALVIHRINKLTKLCGRYAEAILPITVCGTLVAVSVRSTDVCELNNSYEQFDSKMRTRIEIRGSHNWHVIKQGSN